MQGIRFLNELKNGRKSNAKANSSSLFTMEERQIIDAHDSGYIDGQGQKSMSAEQYYTETYEQ
jgi:hypothetical protein